MARKKKKGKRKEYRPEDPEIRSKVYQAIAALECGEEYASIVHDKHNYKAFQYLKMDGTSDPTQILDWALDFLHQIKDADPVECFATTFVKRCTDKGYHDIFLFPYKILPEGFDEVAYLKFGIRTVTTETGKERHYCHLNLHKDEPEKAK